MAHLKSMNEFLHSRQRRTDFYRNFERAVHISVFPRSLTTCLVSLLPLLPVSEAEPTFSLLYKPPCRLTERLTHHLQYLDTPQSPYSCVSAHLQFPLCRLPLQKQWIIKVWDTDSCLSPTHRGRLCLRQPAEQMLSLRLHLLTVSSSCIPHVELKCINLYLRAAQTASNAGRLEGNLRYFDSWVEVRVLEKQHKNIYSLHSNWAQFLNLWGPAEWSFQWNHVWHLLTADKSLGTIKNISKKPHFCASAWYSISNGCCVKDNSLCHFFRLVIQQQLIHVINLGVTDGKANGRKVLHPDTELIVRFLCLISTDFYFSHHQDVKGLSCFWGNATSDLL